jgi:RimJ/RimL family protein N-acetyltransferase
MFFLNRTLPVSDLEHRKWYENIITDNKNVFFSIYENTSSTYVGNVWLWNMDHRNRNGEVRIFVGEKKLWGTGIGTQALNLIVQYATRDLNLHKVYANVHAKNPRGKLSFEKAGFTVEGQLREEFFHDGSYVDVYRLSFIAKPVVETPEEEDLKLKGFTASRFQWFQPK